MCVGRYECEEIEDQEDHPQSENVICPYNASHHVARPEEKFHIATCPDRKIVEMAKYSWTLDRPQQHGNLELPAVGSSSIAFGEDDEDWEKEATIKQSYDPSKKASQSNVLRKLEGATPSERKEFRAKERVRIPQIQAEMESGEVVGTSNEVKGVREESQPLRRPALGGMRPGGANVSALLAAHMGRGGGELGIAGQLRRPGGMVDSWTVSTQGSVNTSTDTLDTSFGLLSLGRGQSGLVQQVPLRRPGGLRGPEQKAHPRGELFK